MAHRTKNASSSQIHKPAAWCRQLGAPPVKGHLEAGDRRYPKHAVKEVSYAEDAEDQGSSGQPSSSPETSYSGYCCLRRQRKEIKYMECEENSDEEYLCESENRFLACKTMTGNADFVVNGSLSRTICDDCGIDYPGDCPEHGPLTHVKDVEVEVVTRFMPTKPSPWALSISRSTIKGAQHCVFTLKPLPRKVYFGPHEGVKVENNGEGNGYNWQALQTQAEAEDRTPRRSAKTARYSWGTDPTGCAT
ncbi:hypothetical protein V5799_008020 [Amblyomma americanum]|uniref:Uncharacterized protein n=1 Tax=Amblyomma americanum TaxID=6943 RepID=A0AAQ4FFW1_AMBAM